MVLYVQWTPLMVFLSVFSPNSFSFFIFFCCFDLTERKDVVRFFL